MNFRLQVPTSLSRFLDCVKPAGRAVLFARAAEELTYLIQRHLLAIVPKHHKTAQELGAVPTGHIEKGANGIGQYSDDHSATVVIPSAGLSRAFHPLHITHKRAPYLTIPINKFSYGYRAYEMAAKFGYKIFRPRGKDILMGKQGDNAPIPLYALKKVRHHPARPLASPNRQRNQRHRRPRDDGRNQPSRLLLTSH